jgi:F0F1-type ATP synthase assembly protein I
MTTLKRALGRRAARATVRHPAHGVAAKVQRRPLRSASPLSAGGVVGAGVGWLAGRRGP